MTTLLWEAWAGACVMVNMSSAGVSSRKTRFLYNTDPFIHEGGKDHSICQINCHKVKLLCCPGVVHGCFLLCFSYPLSSIDQIYIFKFVLL